MDGHGVQGGRLGNKRYKQRQFLMTEGVGFSKDYTAPDNVGCDVLSRPSLKKNLLLAIVNRYE